MVIEDVAKKVLKYVVPPIAVYAFGGGYYRYLVSRYDWDWWAYLRGQEFVTTTAGMEEYIPRSSPRHD